MNRLVCYYVNLVGWERTNYTFLGVHQEKQRKYQETCGWKVINEGDTIKEVQQLLS